MKTLRAERPASRKRFMLCLLVLITGVSVVHADIAARIYKKGVSAPFQGQARWLKSSKVYKLVMRNGQTLTIPLAQVDTTRGINGVQVIEPKTLKPAIKMVKSGRFASAIQPLEKIQKDYAMFQYDIMAVRWLAEAYMGTKKVDKAYSAVLALKKSNPAALREPDFFKIYGKILIEKKLFSEIDKMIKDQIAHGTRGTKAVAQMMRGDIQMKKGDYKGALIDGYLRTMYFYQSEKAIQPEAMLKAITCFQKLGDTTKQEKIRKMLTTRYPTSKEALQAKVN